MDEEPGKDTALEPGRDAEQLPGTESSGEPAQVSPPAHGRDEAESDEAPLATSSAALVAIATDAPPRAVPASEPLIEPPAVLDAQPAAEPDKALVPVAPALPATRTRQALPPLAWSTTLLLVGAGLATVIAAALLGLALTQGDWGSGARAAGLASLALGILCLLVLGVRSAVWRRRVAWGGIAAALICGLLGGSALASANPLRFAQGHRLEAAGDWPGALRAYLLAGDDGTASDDPARVYIEWGDAFSAQGQYAAAIDRYEQAISRYPGAQRELQRAMGDLWPAYSVWLAGPSSGLPYLAMIQSLHGYQHSDWCASACRASAAVLEAQARYAYGQELAAERQYTQAIAYLQSVATTDPTSPYMARAHAAAATAYYALGQSELHGPKCPSALPTYQTLASTYKDTPEGKQAAAALSAPVQVSGKLTGYPTNPAPMMYLSTKAYSVSHFSDDYSAALDASGGFVFTQVNPGRYNLSAAFGDGSGRYWQDTKTNNPYTVAVAPLCALNLGAYSW